MTEDKKNFLDRVNPARREFMQRLLAGAAFAAPLVASFSMDTLTANAQDSPVLVPNSTFFPNSGCNTDAGYAGLRNFLAHVSVATDPPVGRPNGPHAPKVNGEVAFALVGSYFLEFINGEIAMVPGATASTLSILIGPRAAVQIALSGNFFQISANNLNADVVCDLDELADHMASGIATVVVAGTYNSNPYSALGPIVSQPNTVA